MNSSVKKVRINKQPGRFLNGGVAYCSSTVIGYSNMTWYFSSIKYTDTNCALFADKSYLP